MTYGEWRKKQEAAKAMTEEKKTEPKKDVANGEHEHTYIAMKDPPVQAFPPAAPVIQVPTVSLAGRTVRPIIHNTDTTSQSSSHILIPHSTLTHTRSILQTTPTPTQLLPHHQQLQLQWPTSTQPTVTATQPQVPSQFRAMTRRRTSGSAVPKPRSAKTTRRWHCAKEFGSQTR